MTPESIAVNIDPWMIPVLAGTITPLLTGLATKLSASSGVKAIVALALVSLVAIIETISRGNGSFDARELAVLFATTFVAHVASYYGAWKPLGNGTSPTQRATPDVGIG